MCGQDLTKTRAQDQQLWAVLNSTNVTKLHAHEEVQCLWVWTPVLFILSSSYIQSTKQFIHFLSFSQKMIMVLIMLELRKHLWVLVYLIHVALFLSNCVWVSFVHLTGCLLIGCVLATFPSLCSWCSPSLRSWCFSKFLLLQACVWMFFLMVSFFCSKLLVFEVQNSSRTFPCCFWFFNFLLCVLAFAF
jgi:hypothetical protein